MSSVRREEAALMSSRGEDAGRVQVQRGHLDVFIIKDTIGRRYKVMSVVDLGTLFRVAAIVGEGSGPPGSGDMAQALCTCWNWAGIPREHRPGPWAGEP